MMEPLQQLSHYRMTRNDALIQAIEFDLVDFHRQRMAQRAGLQMELLRNEERRPDPDPSRIGRIREAMVLTKRNAFSTSLTVAEVIEPLKHGVSIGSIRQADEFMADPASWPSA
jgi:hypothetical protein